MAETRPARTGITTSSPRPDPGPEPDNHGPNRSTRRGRHAPGRERTVVALCVGVVVLHVLDDNFLQPEPGTAAGDHLVSGLTPIALLAATAAAYPRLRAGARAVLAMTLGALGVAIGTPAAYYLRHGTVEGDHYTGLLALGAGAALVLTGPVILWRKQTPPRHPSPALPASSRDDRRRPGARHRHRVVCCLPDRPRVRLHPHRTPPGGTRPRRPLRVRHPFHRRRPGVHGQLRPRPKPGGDPALPRRQSHRRGAHAPRARVRSAAARPSRPGRKRG